MFPDNQFHVPFFFSHCISDSISIISRSVVVHTSQVCFVIYVLKVLKQCLKCLQEKASFLGGNEGRKTKENVLFTNALNTFNLLLPGIRHTVKDHSDDERGNLLLLLLGPFC